MLKKKRITTSFLKKSLKRTIFSLKAKKTFLIVALAIKIKDFTCHMFNNGQRGEIHEDHFRHLT